MYFLLRMRLLSGRRARVVVSLNRPAADDGGWSNEIIEELEIKDPGRLPERTRGWIIPANPSPGDEVRFELAEIEPEGFRPPSYEWEVAFSDAHGPARMEDPGIFRVVVPTQSEEDIDACPDAFIEARRAVKDGPRSFKWAA
jgi:hypothetical protein